MKIKRCLSFFALINIHPHIHCMEEGIQTKQQYATRIQPRKLYQLTPATFIPSMESEIFNETLKRIKEINLSHAAENEKSISILAETKYLPDYLKIAAEAFSQLLKTPQLDKAKIKKDNLFVANVLNRALEKNVFEDSNQRDLAAKAIQFLRDNDPAFIAEQRERLNRALSTPIPVNLNKPDYDYLEKSLKEIDQNPQHLYDDIVVFYQNILLNYLNVNILHLVASISERYGYAIDYAHYLESTLSRMNNFMRYIAEHSEAKHRKHWLDDEIQKILNQHISVLQFYIDKNPVKSSKITFIEQYVMQVQDLFQRKNLTIKDWAERKHKLIAEFEKSKPS